MSQLPSIQQIAFSDAVAALLRQCDLPTADADASEIVWLGALSSEKPEALIGVVGLQPAGSAGLLRSLAVAPAQRESGLGRALVAHAEATARDTGLEALYLLSIDTPAFFAHLGYEAVPRQDAPAAIRALPQFKGLCPDDAQCMVKSLSERTLPA